MTDLPLAVVGGGPVGATAALALVRRFPARRILWLDRGSLQAPAVQPGFDARVIACTPGSMTFLTELGAWQHLPTTRLQAYRGMKVWDRQSHAHIHFRAEDLGVACLGTILSVADLLRAIQQALDTHPNLELWPGAEVEGLGPQEGGARTLVLKSGEKLPCELILAADGSQSSLRELAGIPTRVRSMQQTALVAVVQHQLPHRETAWQAFDHTGPLAFLPLPPGEEGQHQSAIVWSLDAEVVDSYLRLDEGALASRLTASIDARLGSVLAISGRASFPLRQLHAGRYVQPGLCLLGDAAHTLHPLAGQGANLGFRDVRVLDTELARAVARGISPGHETVLRRYERARKPENLALLAGMEAFRYGFGNSSSLLGWLRGQALRRADAWPALKSRLAHQAML